jgi:polyribonucleotide nucleotidyltransferase
MDFKVAGTEEGITIAIQLDIKLKGLVWSTECRH